MTSVSEENLPSPSRKTALFLFLFGFAVAFVFVFVLYGRQNAVAVAYDVNGFGGLGRRLASGEGFSLGSGLTMRRAPLYPGLVALLLTIFGVSGEGAEIYRPVFFVQCLMVGATGVVVWAIGRELFNERTGRIAGVLTPLLPQTLRYVSSTEVETLMGLLIALMAWTGLRFWRRPGMAQAVLFALVCAASTLTKPMGLPYPFVFCICLFLKFRKTEGSKLFVATGACLGVYLLCLFPWSLRNSIVSEGKFRGISTNAAGEFLRGYVLAQPKFFLLKQDFGGNDSRELIWDVEANDYEQKAMESYSVPFY
ncbi:MAG: glycosyltransferase family 39 protein, partial [Chthonomonadaceae bacterium]|nr:glycosyltransferase family 39 protein [Chthonomonadaceae bacterium]